MMRTPFLIVCLLFPSFIMASGQTWDLQGVHELRMPISQLNPPDRHEILKRLQIVASHLRGEEENMGGMRTFFVSGQGFDLCGATGNCTFWIFDSGHNVLLKTVAQSVKYGQNVHSGRHDALTTLHFSAWQQELVYWEFDGTRYRKVRCAMADYSKPDHTSSRRPEITAEPCQ